MNEIQSIAIPDIQTEVVGLLGDVGLKHLLTDRVFDGELVAVHQTIIAIVYGNVVAGWVREYLYCIGAEN